MFYSKGPRKFVYIEAALYDDKHPSLLVNRPKNYTTGCDETCWVTS